MRGSRVSVIGCLLALVGLLAACGGGSSSSPGEPGAILKAPRGFKGYHVYSYSTPLGTVLGSIDGIVLYTNVDEHGGRISCTGSCTSTWVPAPAEGTPQAAPGTSVNAALLGKVRRPNGTYQVSYNGYPLYTYAHQRGGLQTNGQGSGGVWYVVAVTGNPVR